MHKIVFPLAARVRGAAVTDLQIALTECLERGALASVTKASQAGKKLSAALKSERAKKTYGDATATLVGYFQKRNGLPTNGVVDERTAKSLNDRLQEWGLLAPEAAPVAADLIVRGRITSADGSAAVGLVVRARDKDLRSFQPLGKEAVTDADGRYEIRYSNQQFSRAEKGSADLVVRVFAADEGSDPDVPLIESQVLFNAPADAEIDVRLPVADGAEPSEYERYVRTVEPLLAKQGEGGRDLAFVDLKPEDDGFIAADTGIDRQHIEWLRMAASFDAGHCAEALPYGLFRMGLPTDRERLRTLPLTTIRTALLEAISQNIVPASLRDQVDDFLVRLPNARTDELKALPGLVELRAGKMRALLSAADGTDAVTDQVLTRLLEEKQLTPDDARAVGLSLSLNTVLKGETTLVSRALSARFASLGGRKLEQTRELAALEPADWESVLKETDAQSDEPALKARARALAIDAARAFPHAAFVARATKVPEAVGELKAFANQHPGLGLHDALARATPAEGARIVQERVGWLRTVIEQNPDVNFLGLDYLPDDPRFQQLKFGDLPKEARTLALRDLMAHRRIHAVTGNPFVSREIMRAGFHAASIIARTPIAEFTARVGLPEVEARWYHARARDAADEAAANWLRAYESARDHATSRVRAIPSSSEFFGPLSGFQELINDQPWCECTHCQSVLSPAAYFVDLMYYVEQHILQDSFRDNEQHPLHLKVRRPDLWDELELTCKNTSEYVPYLDLVIEVLEAYLKSVLPAADAADLYEFLARQERSFKQPFTLPIERLAQFLGHFELTRYDVAKAMGAGRDVLVRARFDLSPTEYDLITDPRDDSAALAFITQLFAITDTVSVTTADAPFPPVEMQTLLAAMDLPHETVAAILETRFANNDGSTNPAIEVSLEKRSAQDVQNNVEWVKNLSLARLDRIHRFTRLWRKLPWTVQELDWVLRRLTVLNLGSGIDAGALSAIVDLLELNAKPSLPLDELMSMFDIFPSAGLRGDASLFDRLFNQQPFLSRDGHWPPSGRVDFTHPSWASKPQGYSAPDNNTLTRLLAGLRLTDRDLVELLESLKAVPDLGYQPATIDPVTNQRVSDESVVISRPSLRVLYHHARLMRMLGRSAADFNKLLSLVPQLANRPAPARWVRDLEDVQTVVAFSDAQKASGFTLDEILYVVRGTPTADTVRASELAADIADAVRSEGSLEFADTVFTELGLTDIQSRKVIADNLSTPGNNRAFASLTDGQRYRLRSGFDPMADALTVNDPTISPPLTVARLRSFLARYHALDVLDATLGRTLDLSAAETRLLRQLARPLSASQIAEVTASLHGGNDRQTLVELLEATLRYRALFKAPVFDLGGLGFVNKKPTVFALDSDPAQRAITFDAVRRVASYAALATPKDAEFTNALAAMSIDTLHSVLENVSGAADADLAKVLRTDRARIGSLKPHLSLPAESFAALDILARCLTLTELLGVSGETLILMTKEEANVAASFRNLARAAEDVFAAFRTKYPLEATFQEKLEPYADKLRGRKRDALVDFFTRQWPKPFSDPNKLYAYFLIDPLLGGCARTSRIVAAISSVQLYVQRVIMALEFSRDATVIARFDDPAVQHEWYWRQHYRLWQAAREVFLYPENYLDPMSLDRKTPPYQELEAAFRQGEITDLNVRDAYAKYLDAFDEVARLKIAGAYHDHSVNDSGVARDVLHLFGVTTEAPPSYFYRRIDRASSSRPNPSAWKKLSLRIPVRKVAPIALDGRLHVFWLETVTRPLTSFVGGTSDFSGYRHGLRVKFSTLRPDDTWTAPQSLGFGETATSESRLVNDPTNKQAIELNKQKDSLTTLVGRLAGDVTRAQQELTRREGELTTAQRALATPLTFAEQTDAAPRREAVRLAYVSTYGPALLAGPRLADMAATEAALGVMTTFVPQSSTGTLKAAGVVVGPIVIDAFQIAQRKHAVLIASSLVQIALVQLGFARQQLAPFQLQLDRLQNTAVTVKWDQSGRDHSKPIDDYAPVGWQWERVYPSVRDIPGSTRTIRVVVAPSDEDPKTRPLELDATAGLLREIPLDESHWPQMRRLSNSNGAIKDIGNSEPVLSGISYFFATRTLNTFVQSGTQIATIPADADVQVVNGDLTSLIIESQGDVAWLRLGSDFRYKISRLSTGLTAQLIKRFAERDDMSGLLDLSVQESLKERRTNIQGITGQSTIDMQERPFDPNRSSHPYLDYLRETFLHIPFLGGYLANGDQKFAQAQRWYHYIFNPTADGDPWRCLELQLANRSSLRSLLTNTDALAAYRADPFNPHVIARTRLTAYQKAVVMRYIDNLLDWGDALFSQFTMESVNEATMVYVMAQEILGPRPPQLGPCGEGQVTPRTYGKIREGLNEVSDFLIELEAMAPLNLTVLTPQQEGDIFVVTPVGTATNQQASTVAEDVARADVQSGTTYWSTVGGTPLSDMYVGSGATAVGGPGLLGIDAAAPRLPGTAPAPIDFENPLELVPGGTIGVAGRKVEPFDRTPPFEIKYTDRDIPRKAFVPGKTWQGFTPIDVVTSVTPNKNTAFCIPPNRELLAYWDRVDDRLFKIRNCMDIAGVRRRLELFAPRIDPRLLVRMKAAGLTLDDVLNSIAGNVPPYRFTYLIDKTKQFAGTLQSFGSQLMSALEKRDAEELSRLRAVHEQNLLAMRRRTTRLEIEAAEDTIASLEQQKVIATYRQEYYRSLSTVGLIPAEHTQQLRQKEASQFRTMASVTQFLAGILSVIPDLGAPTAMKFGGSQLGAAGRSVAEGFNAIAAFNDMSATEAGIEASNRRRDQEWKHQAEAARLEILQIDRQIEAAKIRKEIADEAQKLHEKSIEQAEQAFEFLRDKFSNFDRAAFLTRRLRELLRVAYKSALSLARMTEQAFAAERTEDDTRLTGDYWDTESLGLLAGERLLSDLQALELRYLEKNYRQLEVEQSFSLAQFAPELLAKLRLDGSCEFSVPELFFDLIYPGHYRRRVKAVRITIPCVIGPYVNIGATLRLVSSSIRLTPSAAPVAVPLRHTVSITVSNGQYDAGALDFSFRDERYMPFEGAGAISTWNLSLPKTIRMFDYATISDVILHVSYTADFDGRLQSALESELQSEAARLLNSLQAKDPQPGSSPVAPLTRVFSLRHDFPDVFSRLVNSPIDTEVALTIDGRHFPFFVTGRPLKAVHATLRVLSPLKTLTPAGAASAVFAIRQKVELNPPRGFRELPAPSGVINTAGLKAFDFGNVLSKAQADPGGIMPPLLGEYLIVVKRAGPLAPQQDAEVRALDPEKAYDILIAVGYGLA